MMASNTPHRKVWTHDRWLSEHAFDKLRLIDCTLGEFASALDTAEVIETTEVEDGGSKELLLVGGWVRPLHVVVIVDHIRMEERVVTVDEPDPDAWSADYGTRRA